jgi:uncharacterized protein YjiS (DUF1127 family)
MSAASRGRGALPIVAAAPAARRHWLLARLAGACALLRLWRERQRSRRELARLMRSGPHLIEDIGLMRVHADREAAKPFWRR